MGGTRRHDVKDTKNKYKESLKKKKEKGWIWHDRFVVWGVGKKDTCPNLGLLGSEGREG